MKKLFTRIAIAAAIFALSAPAASAEVKIGETTYTTLKDAFTNVADGDVITISGENSYNNTYKVGTKKITIQGEGADATIKVTSKMIFNGSAEGTTGSVTLKNLTIASDGTAYTTNLIKAVYGGILLENVTISGFNYTVTDGGLVKIYAPTGSTNTCSVSLKNVHFVGCTNSDKTAYPEVSIASNTVTVSGVCDFSAAINDTATLIASDFSSESNISLTLKKTVADAIVVKGTENVKGFNLTNEGYHLEGVDGNLILKEGASTGIDGIEAANDADAIYYTIDGIRTDAANLTPGLYIRVAGGKATKVIVR